MEYFYLVNKKYSPNSHFAVFFHLLMARISEQIIEQIRSTADIIEVVSGYVQLKNEVVITSDSALFMEKRLLLFR